MKFVSLNKGYDFIHEENLLQTLLLNRDVTEPDRLLNLTKKEVHDGMLLKNMGEGLEMLHKHIKNNSKIHILIDVDADGITSAGMMYLYIKDINPDIEITYSMNEGKKHGIILEGLTKYKYNIIIVPDAGSNDIKQCKELASQGIDVLVLDHHDIDEHNLYATVINCKDDNILMIHCLVQVLHINL